MIYDIYCNIVLAVRTCTRINILIVEEIFYNETRNALLTLNTNYI